MYLPKLWLIHDVIYKEYQERDAWGDESYKEAVKIKGVRVDLSTVHSRDLRNETIVANATVFVCGKNSKPLLEFKEKSLIEFKGEMYTISTVIPHYNPVSDTIHHYELQVV